ncbi:MAG: SH3 domain-containing protein [Chloroflexota bacterium]
MNNPLSFKNLLAGIIVTVIGGVILAFILGETIFSREEPPVTTNVVTPSGAQVVEAIVTTEPAPVEENTCGNAPEKRLSLGMNAIVCTAGESVNLRSGPRRSSTSIDSLSPGTRLVVIGEAMCDENVSWWYWEVQTDKGFTGWVSEGGDETDPYFVCPAQ